MNMLDVTSSVRIAHIACYWKLLVFALCTRISPLSVQALQSRSCLSYTSYATPAAKSLGRKLDHRTASPRYIAPPQTALKTALPLLRVLSLPGNVSTELFPSKGCCTVACLHSCCLAMGLHVATWWKPNSPLQKSSTRLPMYSRCDVSSEMFWTGYISQRARARACVCWVYWYRDLRLSWQRISLLCCVVLCSVV
jgi:hypothetical protein